MFLNFKTNKQTETPNAKSREKNYLYGTTEIVTAIWNPRETVEMQQVSHGKRCWVRMIVAKSRATLSSGSLHSLSSRFLSSLCPITDSCFPPFLESSLSSSLIKKTQLAKFSSAESSPQCPAYHLLLCCKLGLWLLIHPIRFPEADISPALVWCNPVLLS